MEKERKLDLENKEICKLTHLVIASNITCYST